MFLPAANYILGIYSFLKMSIFSLKSTKPPASQGCQPIFCHRDNNIKTVTKKTQVTRKKNALRSSSTFLFSFVVPSGDAYR
jgi:hypothetical protein